MALPDNTPSDIPIIDELLEPDSMPFQPRIVFERGGIDIKDPSQGLMVRDWYCWYDEENEGIRIQSFPDKDYQVLDNIQSVLSLDFTFDQNMNYTITYESSEYLCKLHWFDAAAQSYVESTFAGIRDPRLTLDDKRQQQLNASDIIFAYIKVNGDMAYRQQRDRFGIERILAEGIPNDQHLLRIGLSKKNRLQFNTTQKKFLPFCGEGVNIS